MAKDERLWMRFPIDMHRDMKVARLSDEAFRVFFAMNGEARLEQNDGVFDKEDAEFRWPATILAELAASHPTEPLVIATADTYTLRRYARHQFTEADRERLSDKRAEAGKAGAQKRWGSKPMANDGKPMASAKQMVAGAMANDGKAWQAIAESESESELDKDLTNTGSVSPVSDRARNAGLTDRGIRSIINAVSLHCDIDATEAEAVELAEYVASKAKTAVKSPAAYVRNAIETGPSEISAWFRAARRRKAVA